MPIHDQGYQHYQGTRARTGAAWQVIAKAATHDKIETGLFNIWIFIRRPMPGVG